ncbi:zinc finger CCCH domain-containing protein 13-like isoform X2 [Papaver somniferum]|uniref:zinc finger CCCH domain-containing protein 13-like isoform X2 n=1 Tax=Papaver somniferum TaxID=3469 RepID=UPI000E6FC667|nr:zinc finger CCCH domain-containing protein 13-like isoform X2 [Papaver somniferum]
MDAGKHFKTKICVLFQRGHCSRQNCSFAHGNEELRRFSSGSFNGFSQLCDLKYGHNQISLLISKVLILWFPLELTRSIISIHYKVSHIAPCNGEQEYRGNDLRDRLGRRHSPQRRFSPVRDSRDQNAFHGQKQHHFNRGCSPPRSPGKKRWNQHLAGQTHATGNFKERRPHGGDDVDLQVKHMQLAIGRLDDHKSQLESHMEERILQSENLATRIEELEAHLIKEQEDCKRITSKVKKFIKAHVRHSRAQEELEKSQAWLQKLGDQLASDASRPSANKEGLSLQICRDGEFNQDDALSPRKELQNHASPFKKRLQSSIGVSKAKQANMKKSLAGPNRLEKFSQRDRISESEHNPKEGDSVNNNSVGSKRHRSLGMENKSKRRKNDPSSIASLEKAKGVDSGHMLPSTSMAAHAVDEFTDTIDMDEKIEEVDATTNGVDKALEKAYSPLPPPPPPPPRQDVYIHYETEEDEIDAGESDGNPRDRDIHSEEKLDLDTD